MDSKAQPTNNSEYTPPEGSTTEHAWSLADSFRYRAIAEWMLLREKEKPVAEIFHVAYLQEEAAADRPITFVFNGGPGAASAFLHVGAVGPRRVVFAADGTAGPPPVRIVDNAESWLPFTDLVFVDPVGTGFSRAVPGDAAGGGAGANVLSSTGASGAGGTSGAAAGSGATGKGGGSGQEEKEKEFFGLNRDLKALGEFMQKFLSKHGRWESPVFVAGESYGGFRAAKLTKLLQEGYGIGLNGAVLISPALEFSLLDSSDYDVLPWVDLFPSLAAAAAFHKKGRWSDGSYSLEAVLSDAEHFAAATLPAALIRGGDLDDVLVEAASRLGLSSDLVAKLSGRVSARRFVRELLAQDGMVCGMYDATITARDPYPDRESYEGPDPTLFGIERVFASGINSHLRGNLGVQTDRDYHLLSMDVNRSWKIDADRHALESQVGATDDLRYGMSLNPHLKVRISHGIYDLVTPYFSSNRLARLMRLQKPISRNGATLESGNLSLVHYGGGHMFYAWEESRRSFRNDISDFYQGALAGGAGTTRGGGVEPSGSGGGSGAGSGGGGSRGA